MGRKANKAHRGGFFEGWRLSRNPNDVRIIAKIQGKSTLERGGNGKVLRQEGLLEAQKASVARAEWILMRAVGVEEGKKMKFSQQQIQRRL